jgi:hypothetical protein
MQGVFLPVFLHPRQNADEPVEKAKEARVFFKFKNNTEKYL